MADSNTTKSSADIVCELSDMVTAKRASVDQLKAALIALLQVCKDADPEEAIFPQQMEAARRAIANAE
jgi:uncharacterized coiled-coil protein SlyX